MWRGLEAVNPAIERKAGNWERSFWTGGGMARKEARWKCRLRGRRGVENNRLQVICGHYLMTIVVNEEVKMLQEISPKKRN